MNADAEFNLPIVRHSSVALDHPVLNFDCAAHSVDHTAELDQSTVARPLNDAPAMHGNGWVNEIAAQRPQPRQSATFVRLGEATVADDVGGQYRCKLPGFRHSGPRNL